MQWLLQRNAFERDRWEELLAAFRAHDLAFQAVTLVPVVQELRPEVAARAPVAVLGTCSFVQMASRRGWGPGVFALDRTTCEVYGPVLRDLLLNGSGHVCRLGDLTLDGPAFVRPVADGKTFAGRIVWPEELESWRSLLLERESGDAITTDTRVLAAPPREILAEFRFFLVDGVVVGRSRYRLDGRLAPAAGAPLETERLALAAAARWSPDRAFVADVAVTPDGPRVIEFNNLNAAGWYAADIGEIAAAVDRMAW